MAAYISFQPSDYYTTHIYAGTSSAPFAQTGIGFQPDTVWTKPYDYTDPMRAVNSVRGGDYSLKTSTNGAEQTGWTPAAAISAWGADGYTIGTTDGGFNSSAYNYIGYCWKAGTTSGLSGGTITPTAYSFSTVAGISILQWTGTGSAGTIPHGLGAVPQMIIVKQLNSTNNWCIYNTTIGNAKFLKLNTDSAEGSASAWNNTTPTSTLFSVGSDAEVNASGSTYIAYCYTSITGYSKVGAYTGNGDADGPFIYTGFRPAWLMIKRYDSTAGWEIFNSKRLGWNGLYQNLYLYTDADNVEQSNHLIDLVSNGFKLKLSAAALNNGDYIYMAFAEFPLVSSNSKAGVAR